jgi:C4-dicarboxylate-specific signal transduction histidine kinase
MQRIQIVQRRFRLEFCVFWVAWLFAAAPLAARERPTDVLLIYSQNRLLAANIQADRGLISPGSGTPHGPALRFATEYLDYPEFSGDEHERRTAAYLRDKYASRPPKVILVGGDFALDFVLRFRQEMFPGVPVMHMGVDHRFLEAIPNLPADVKGVYVVHDIAGTIALALQFHPKARHLFIVTGISDRGTEHREAAAEALTATGVQIEATYWSGLPTHELLARLASLPPDSIVFTPGYYRDGAGTAFTPVESVELMASVSAAPIYSIFSTHIGLGAVGGRMVTFEEIGRAARRLLEDFVAGRKTDSEAMREMVQLRPQLDWRQLRKWKVAPELVPEDAVIHFREPSFMELYRSHAVAGGLVFLAQALLISALLVERRRRQRTARALTESQHHLSAATKAARLGTFNWDLCLPRSEHGAQPRRPPTRHGGVIQHVEDFVERVHPSDRERLAAAIDSAVDRHEELDIELRLLEKKGSVSWIEVRGQVLDGCHITGVTMDITERKEAEAQSAEDRAMMMHLSRISTVGQLSVGIAHQLNQPLAAIRFNTDTARKILKRLELGAGELKEILDDINEENKRAADIIRNVSALYRRAPVEAARFEINELVLETVQLLKEEAIWRHVTVRVEPAVDLPPVRGSRVQIQQVLLNLMLNGMQAMSETPNEIRVLILQTAMDDRWVTVTIADHGKGIAQEELEHIFDPFWTTKENGIGVGLPISRAILEAHHGTIAAASRSDGGAAFTISLPISEPA